jgi:hypothetical protein
VERCYERVWPGQDCHTYVIHMAVCTFIAIELETVECLLLFASCIMAPKGHRAQVPGPLRHHHRTSSGGSSKIEVHLQITQKDVHRTKKSAINHEVRTSASSFSSFSYRSLGPCEEQRYLPISTTSPPPGRHRASHALFRTPPDIDQAQYS